MVDKHHGRTHDMYLPCRSVGCPFKEEDEDKGLGGFHGIEFGILLSWNRIRIYKD